MIIKFAENNNGRIARKEAAELLKINEAQAYRLLKKMADEGRLSLVGKGKFAYYTII